MPQEGFKILALVSGLASVLGGLVSTILGFFILRLIRQYDENDKELFDSRNDHERRLSQLEGEHKARHS